MSKSIVYISANTEPENIARLCRKNLMRVNMSCISVSQEPLSFGHNICIGRIGQAEMHIFMQMYIGCMNTLADTIYWCEADTLYPPEHFSFEPENPHAIYFNDNIWRWYKGHYVKKRKPSACSIVARREHLIKTLEYILFTRGSSNKDWKIRFNQQIFTTHQPIINIYHSNGTHKRLSATVGKLKHNIPYWPKASALLKG